MKKKTPASVEPVLITGAAASQQFDLSGYEPFGEMNFKRVILFNGDAYLKGDLNQQWTKSTLELLGADGDVADTLILVNGNLTVAGTIKPTEDSFPFLLVLGNVRCDVLQSYDECIYITGDADITYAFDGNYNDGSITIAGITRVPYVLNSNHNSVIKPEGAMLINYFGDNDDFFTYDFTIQDFQEVMVKAVFDKKMNFDQAAFIELLKAGKSPLKKGARPARLKLLDEIAKVGNGNAKIQEQDLTDKKLKEFPGKLLKMTGLKKLMLSENPIGSIPAGIKELEQLEELHLEKCELESLDEAIGGLKQLTVLNVSGNGELSLPATINELSLLRELHISRNQGFGLPASVTGLKHLEELHCNKCSDAAPGDLPEVITQLTGLKELDISGNSIKTIPESFLNLESLEVLKLNASLCYLNELPDLSKLKNLKTLHANGMTGFSTRPSPKQSLLRSFFTITSLEALYLDRHGVEKLVIKAETFDELQQNLAHDPERLQAYISLLPVDPTKRGDIRKGIVREALKAEHLAGISNLQNLKTLDLSFNDLTSLPEELFTLKKLKTLDLKNNRLPASEQKKIAKKLPGCKIDFSGNR